MTLAPFLAHALRYARNARVLASALPATCFVFAFLLASPAAAQTTADAVLARALAAMGGADVIDGVKTLVVSAENVRHLPGRTVKVPTTTYFQFPFQVRHEMEIDGKRAALVSTLDGAVLVTPEGNVDLSNRARVAVETPAMRNPVSLLRSRHARDVSFVHRGPGKVGDSNVELLEMKVGPHVTTLAFEVSTGRLVRQVYRSPPGDDIEGDVVVTYTEFRNTAAGLVYPFASRAEANGELRSTTRVTQLRVNEPIDPDLFPSPEGSGDRAPPPGGARAR